mgnify:CR=1 FL=1
MQGMGMKEEHREFFESFPQSSTQLGEVQRLQVSEING